ncbi:MAG TPA: helix-turn-helix domain-containing protein [Actinomycetes bacterium]
MSVGQEAGTSTGGSRPYHSPRRAEQATATRQAIVGAAARLFAERGYHATTMAAIAEEARVAVKSVYTLAEKPQLLLLALDQTIAGDDAPVPVAERPEARAVLEAADARRQVELTARLGARMLLRLFRLYRSFEQAASADPGLRDHWREYQRRRHQDVGRLVEAIAANAPLRDGFAARRATDTIWALVTWHPVALLVEERGWTQADLEAWLEDLLAALLLPADRPQDA